MATSSTSTTLRPPCISLGKGSADTIKWELRFRHAHAKAEVERAKEYLHTVPDCRGRGQLEDGTLAHTAVAAQPESLTALVTGKDVDHAPEPSARPKCQPRG